VRRLVTHVATPWQQRCVPVAEAIATIPAGASIFVGSGCATPRTLLAELERRSLDHPGVRLVSFLTVGISGGGDAPSVLRHRLLYLGRDAALVSPARLDYVPVPLGEVPELIRTRRLRVDVALVQVSPPDARGMCSLGVSVDATLAAVRGAGSVIAEINPAMPRTGAPSMIPFDQLDHLVEVAPEVAEYHHVPVGDVAERIARYVARLVDDGACVQAGLGRIPAAVLPYLTRRRDLGIHSDVVGDSLVDLVEAGVVTGRHKTSSRGKIVASMALGTRRLFDFLDGNPQVVLRPIDQVCDPAILAGEQRMVSITQAYGADLTGQVTAESRDGQAYGGVAAATAFHHGAVAAQNGRAIVCLSSLTDTGASAIVTALSPQQPVTFPRWDVHWVVTEYGLAYLHGMSLRERAVALIELAHPDHRARLLAEAKAAGLVPEDQRQRSRRDYPVEEERTIRLRDGRQVLLRPTRTTDAGLLQELFFQLSDEDVVTRFFRKLSSLTRQMAEHLCSVSYEGEMAFAAVVGDAEDERIVAASSYFVDPATGLADVAYMVDPNWQGLGLGRALHLRTLEYALAHGVRGFSADLLVANEAMMAIFAGSPGTLEVETSDGVHEVTLRFGPSGWLRSGGPLDEADAGVSPA
jgi:acyl-CoA hydrolase/GNAT superfamily N-acetyltransferase